jgi:hypothetical protein
MMKQKTIVYLTALLLAASIVSCAASVLSWSAREDQSDPMRRLVGLPAVAIGNLNPSSRNPGLELYCTSLFDSPGGFCNYFAPGTPFLNYSTIVNITVSDSK